jgi:hypothetical protein
MDLIDSTIDLACDLPDDAFGSAAACQAATGVLSEWLNSVYERH